MAQAPAPADEVKPPWVAYPGRSPDDFFWREAAEPWLNLVWRPYWNGLDEVARGDYLARFPPPQDWQSSFLDERLDRLVAEIDAQDSAAGVLPAAPRSAPRGGLGRLLRRLLLRPD